MYTLPVGFFFSALVNEMAEAPPRGVDTEEAIGTPSTTVHRHRPVVGTS